MVDHVVIKQLQSFLGRTIFSSPILIQLQSRYKAETVLLAWIDNYWETLNGRNTSLLILLNECSMYVDIISHSIFLEHLSETGMGGMVLRCFSLFLLDRSKKSVLLGFHFSLLSLLFCDSPKGSVLLHVLFNINTKVQGKVVRKFLL